LTASKLKHRESTIWQRRFWEHPIRDENDFARHTEELFERDLIVLQAR
jgi:putative transposase